jgi:hypothetical protein
MAMVRTPVEEGSVPLQATQLRLLVALVGVAALVLPISFSVTTLSL